MKYGSTAYIAGPMSIRKNDCYNFHMFFYWQVTLERSGYTVINPAEMDCRKALYSEWYPKAEEYEEILSGDLKMIAERADWLFVLKGWEDSPGAKREIKKAEELGIPVFYEGEKL